MSDTQGATTVAVLGAGSWGTALALHACHAGHQTRLWGRDASRVAEMRARRANDRYLPGFELPPELLLTADPGLALEGADIVVSAVPSRYLRSTWLGLEGLAPRAFTLVSSTKGIEEDTGLRMTEVLGEVVGGGATLAVLSGPSFARELAEGHPTAVVVAADDAEVATRLQHAFSHGPLRVYRNRDVIGVELGGALKNVIALAAGIVDGLGLGSNSRAALICRGLKEMSALALRLGAEPATLMGLAGLGDLVLTCTGPLSRNRAVGERIGRGATLQQVTESMHMVAEGVVTVRSARQLAARHAVEMPITEQVYRTLYEGVSPQQAIEELLSRALVEE